MDQSKIQALQLLGFSVIPIKPKAKIAGVKWTEFQNRKADSEQISAWQNQGFVNFAVVTGKISGVIVVDIDNAEAYEQVAKLGVPDNAPIVSTGKGYHIYFSYPDAIAAELGKVKTGVNIGGIQGLDLRADGGYVLAPGAMHPSGRAYTWYREPRSVSQSDFTPIFPPCPEWLLTILRTKAISDSQTKGAGGPRIEDLGNGGPISEGGRNHQLMRIAASRRQRGASRREIYERLVSENERCVPPLGYAELQQITDSVCRYEPEIKDYHLTESGNAQRMIDTYGEDIMFSPSHKKWLTWNGVKWVVDDAGTILKYAQLTALSILDDADKVKDEKTKKALYAFAMKSEELKKLTATVGIAKAYLAVPNSAMDRNPWIMNCPNGMIDLQTGELLPHDRKEYCTKVAGAEYHPEAECPRWLQFIDEITDGDIDLQGYLQRIVGYSLTGDTSEHVWFLLLGNGRNGKSTFLNAVQEMLNDYGGNIRPEALLMQGMDRVPNDLAALKGARFTAASETPASRKLNESLIKQLTGGDAVQARFLFSEFFEFKPQCKLFLATNYRPNIQGTDVGIWRRTHEVPFAVSIPESQVDPNLQNKLSEELAGILAWAVRGCIAWQRGRLNPPQAVQKARAEYYEEMDTVGAFLKEWCEVDPHPKESTKTEHVKDLYTAFVGWCQENSEELLTKKAFGMKLNQRNIPACRMADGGRGRQGVRLLAHNVQKHGGKGYEWRIESV